MPPRNHSTNQGACTPDIPALLGSINVGDFRVPYLSVGMTLRQVSECLNLVTDDKKYANQNWSINELFQREIDHKRVEDIAKNYLNKDTINRPPFFNSLTVVLNVKEMEKHTSVGINNLYDGDVAIDMGPITVAVAKDQMTTDENGNEFPKPGQFAIVRWNKDEVNAVAIDGQHRLAALKKVYDEGGADQMKDTVVNILLIVFDKKIGFSDTNEEKHSKLDRMRSIFIDLNKHAKTVSTAREILLDDLDPTSRMVRSLLGRQLQFHNSGSKLGNGLPLGDGLPLGEIELESRQVREFELALPLDLVDWHSEAKSKVDEGTHLTSILNLQWIVKKLLSINKSEYPIHLDQKIFNPDSEKYDKELLKNLQRWNNSWLIGGIKKKYESTDFNNNEAFSLSREDVDILTKEFTGRWAKSIIRIFTEFRPYKEFCELRVKSNTLIPLFGQWYQSYHAKERYAKKGNKVAKYYEDRYNAVLNTVRDAGIQPSAYDEILKQCNDHKKGELFFYLTAQRALFIALKDLVHFENYDQLVVQRGMKREDIEDYLHEPENWIQDETDCVSWYLIRGLQDQENVTPSIFKTEGRNRQADLRVEDPDKLTKNLDRLFWTGSLFPKNNPNTIDFSEAAANRTSKWLICIAHLRAFLICEPNFDLNLICDAPFNSEPLNSNANAVSLAKSIINVVGTSRNANASPMYYLVNNDEAIPEKKRLETAKQATKERLKLLLKIG